MEAKKHIHVYGKWVSTLGIGLLGNWAITWAFDFLLYPYVIFKFGILGGAPIMIVLSFIICYATILFYDWAKKDWIGIETLKEIKEREPKNMMGKLLTKLVRKSDPLALIILSIQFDPFITVAYMRHGAHQYNGLSMRDWKIFINSLVIGDIYWTLTVYMGITLVEALWRFFV